MTQYVRTNNQSSTIHIYNTQPPRIKSPIWAVQQSNSGRISNYRRFFVNAHFDHYRLYRTYRCSLSTRLYQHISTAPIGLFGLCPIIKLNKKRRTTHTCISSSSIIIGPRWLVVKYRHNNKTPTTENSSCWVADRYYV